MRIALTATFVSFLIAAPFITSAQTAAELQAKIDALLQQIQALQGRLAGQTATPAAAPAACPNITRTLAVGARGTDVTALQDFLRIKGYMTDESTGYFGPLTEAAVKRMQAGNNVVSSGTAATTGYGAVGPKTRTLIASLCVSASVAAPAQQCAQATSATAPTVACAGRWEKMQNLGCHIGWRCVLPTTVGNKPPIITSIEGPGTLDRDAFGTWKINALDPEGGILTYSATWGDEDIADVLNALAGLGGTFTSASTFTHSYAKVGTFTLQVTAKDTSGATAVAALSIKVGTNASSTATTSYTPVDTTPSASACITPWGNQVVSSSGMVNWQPFFTEGAYFSSTTVLMKCDNGAWKKCDAMGGNCQVYTHPTSTPSTAALPSFTTSVGQSCSPEGSTRQVQVPPGTQLCQWLSCRITTQVETATLKCTHSGWTDYANY